MTATQKPTIRANNMFARMRFQNIFAVLLTLVVLSTNLNAQNADINLLRKINLPVNPGLDRTMKGFSQSIYPVCLAVPVGIGIYYAIQKAPFDSYRKPMVIGAALGVTAGATFALKIAVNRPRPFVTYPDLRQGDHVGPYSFPSGHTSTAFAMATSLSLCYPKWYVIAPAALWAVTVGYSRMRLGVHFPTDVLAGALIGSGCAVGMYYLNRRLGGGN